MHDELRALDSSPTTQPFKSIVLDLSTNYAYEQVLRQVRKSSSEVEGGSGGGGDGWYVCVCVCTVVMMVSLCELCGGVFMMLVCV